MQPLKAPYALLLACLLGACAATRPTDLGDMSFSSEPLVGKAVWHDLITQDLEATRRFYGDLFGWSFETTTGANGREYLLAKNGNAYVAGMLEATPRSDGSNVSRWLPYVSVINVDDAAQRAASAGGEVLVAPRNVAIGRVAAITDAEGAVIGLARSSIGDPDDVTTAGAPGSVVWNELLADDATDAARFYESVFGYEAREIDRRGGTYIVLDASGRERAGILAKPVDEWEPVWLTYFGVADPAAATERVAALGGRVIAAPSPNLREGSMALIADPSGAILVLQRWTGQ